VAAGADEPYSAGATGSSTSGSQSVHAGRVGRAHGLDGSFYVTGARARLLTVGTLLTCGERVAPIVRRSGTSAHPIVRLRGVEDRNSAEALRGNELTVERSDAPTLEEGEWWASELEGCEVVDGEQIVGIVSRLLELPSCEVLEVRLTQPNARAAAGELLVPMVRDAIREVDMGRRRIDVDMRFLEDA
jgi:16S rRNA processing protein RimM